MTPLVTMRQALGDPDLFGAILAGESWAVWRVLLIAAMGELLTDDEREIFKRLTGREREPLERVEEFWGVIGRRGGKSRAVAVLLIYLAVFVDYADVAAIGERLIVLCLAQNAKQAGVVFGYVAGIIKAIPALAALVTNETAESLSLANGLDIEVRAASFRGLRGVSCAACVCDEIGFWFEAEDSLNPASAILSALRPSLSTTNGLLAAMSSPHAKKGPLWDIYKRDYGPNGDPLILVAQGASRDLNPGLPQRVVDRAFERDPASAAAEYGGGFRDDLESYASQAAIDSAVVLGRRELPPVPDVTFVAFGDAAGGSGGDSMTVAIAFASGDEAVLAAIREARPPFSPETVVKEFAELLARYRLHELTSDRWASGFVGEAWARCGISHRTAEKTKSQLYGEFLPLLNSGRIELLDQPRLLTQLAALERRVARGGRDSIDHPPGGHDDVINAAAGALVLAAGVGKTGFNLDLWLKATA